MILEADPQFQATPDKLRNIYLKSAAGGAVPLSAITQVSQISSPILISHMGQFPATTVSFNLAPGASLGQAVDAIQKVSGRSPLRPRCRPRSRAPRRPSWVR